MLKSGCQGKAQCFCTGEYRKFPNEGAGRRGKALGGAPITERTLTVMKTHAFFILRTFMDLDSQ